MSVYQDFSFKNPLISDYFNGSDKYVPVNELMYLHSHPTISPNFISELEVLISKVGELMVEKKMKGHAVAKFVGLTKTLGRQLPLTTESGAAYALDTLREIYLLSNKLLSQSNAVNANRP